MHLYGPKNYYHFAHLRQLVYIAGYRWIQEKFSSTEVLMRAIFKLRQSGVSYPN